MVAIVKIRARSLRLIEYVKQRRREERDNTYTQLSLRATHLLFPYLPLPMYSPIHTPKFRADVGSPAWNIGPRHNGSYKHIQVCYRLPTTDMVDRGGHYRQEQEIDLRCPLVLKVERTEIKLSELLDGPFALKVRTIFSVWGVGKSIGNCELEKHVLRR